MTRNVLSVEDVWIKYAKIVIRRAHASPEEMSSN